MYITIGIYLSLLTMIVWLVLLSINLYGYLHNKTSVVAAWLEWSPIDSITTIAVITIFFVLFGLLMVIAWPVIVVLLAVAYIICTKKYTKKRFHFEVWSEIQRRD
jgi:uncharacterized membrane protein